MEVQLTSPAEQEAPELDAGYLTLAPPVQGVTLRLSAPLQLATGDRSSGAHLLAVSNTFGWVAAAGNQGFNIFPLANLRSTLSSAAPHSTPDVTPHLHIPTSSPVDHLHFAMSEKIVVAGMRDATIGVWRLKSLAEGNPAPLHLFPSAGSPLLSLHPCPAPSSPLVALLTTTSLGFINLETHSAASPFPPTLGATAACWSVKGKQLAVGTASGLVGQWTPEGVQKAELQLPGGLSSTGGAWEVKSLEWLENTVWLVTYGRPTTGGSEPTHEDEVYVVTKTATGVEYARFMDPTPAFGMMSREGRRWVGRFKGWEPYKHLLFMASGPSGDIGVLSQSSTTPQWSTLALPDTSRPSLPLGPEGDDVCPLGLGLDLTSSEGDPQILVYTSQGVLVVWRVRNEMTSKGSGVTPYPHMRRSKDVITQEDQADLEDAPSATAAAVPALNGNAMAITPAASPAPTPFGAPSASPFAVGGFGAPSASPFAVGSSAPGAPKAGGFGAPAFGGSAFGGGGFGASAFGGGTAATSTSTSSPSAPAFGASPFGKMATPTTTPATSTTSTASPFTVPSSGGFAGFGAASTATSAFGAAAATSPSGGGGASPFGSGAAFGAAPAFGKSAFGAAAGTSSSPFGVAAAAPATPTSVAGGFAGFGSAAVAAAGAATGGGFGAFSKPATSAFGTPSTPAASSSPFGATAAKTSPFAAPSGPSPFASSSHSPFGAAATPTTTASTSTSTSTPSAFASGGSAFGAGGVSSFASPSSFTTPSASKPAFSARAYDSEGSDEEPTGEEEKEEVGRVDEPPDLEPTVTGLDLNAAMKGAKSSVEGGKSGAGAFSSGSSSAFGFGGLGFGAPPPPPPASSLSSASSSTPAAAPISIFGSAAAAVKTPPAVGFGFGSSSTTSASVLKPATGFSFGGGEKKEEKVEERKEEMVEKKKEEEVVVEEPSKSEPEPAVEEPKEEGKPVDVDSSATELELEGSKQVTPPSTPPAAAKKEDTPSKEKKEEEEEDSSSPTTTTKSFFGFSSSPPLTPSAQGSLLGRVEAAHEAEEGGEDEQEGEEYEEEEEGEGEYDEEYDEGHYDDDNQEEEEEVHYEGESNGEEEAETSKQAEDDDKSKQDDSPAPAAPSSSLLSRLSPAPPSPSPAPTPSTSISAATAPAFSFASATRNSATAPTKSPFSFAPSSTPTPATTSAAESAPAPKAATKPSFGGFGGFAAPASTLTPVSAPTVKAPAFSFASAAPGAAPTPSLSTSIEEAKPTFAGFGAPPASTPAAAVEAPKPTFGGFGQPAATPPPAAEAKTPTSFLGFKNTAPKASSPLSAAPATSSFLAPSGTTAPKASSPLSFGAKSPFGAASSPTLSLPPAAAVVPLPPSAPQSPAPSSLGGFAGFGKPAVASPGPSPFAQSTPAPTPVPAPAPSTPQPRVGPSLSSTSTPKLGGQLVKTEQPKVHETGMAGEFLKAFLRVEKDFEILRTNAAVFKTFVKDIGQPYQTPEQPVNYDDRHWSLGDLGRLRQLTEKVEPGVSVLVDKAQQQKRQAAELQSLMLKAETKREEAARFIRARSDPVFAKMVRVRQLGPEQVENQKKIRLAMEAVRGRVEQVEDHVIALKDKIMEDRLGRSSFKAPSLDTVNRAIRNVTAAVSEKTLDLDEIAGRLDLLRLVSGPGSLAVSTRRRSPSISVEDSLSTSIFRASPRAKTPVVHTNPDVVATAKAALDAERSAKVLKTALLSVRTTPVVNRRACASATSTSVLKRDLGDLQLAFANGAITGDRLPLPRRPPPPPSPAPSSPESPVHANAYLAALPSPAPWQPSASFGVQPTTAWSVPPTQPEQSAFGAPPPLTFKAPVSFSFAAPTAAPSTTPFSTAPTAAAAGGSRARGSTRQHSSAVQLRPAGASSPAATVAGGAGDVAAFWGAPPTTTPSRPTGFVPFGAAASKPASANGFGHPEEDEEEESDDYEEEDPDGFEQDEEYEGEGAEFDEEAEGEGWSDGEDEEGLDTIGEEEEE